jgi:hypothetical protein
VIKSLSAFQKVHEGTLKLPEADRLIRDMFPFLLQSVSQDSYTDLYKSLISGSLLTKQQGLNFGDLSLFPAMIKLFADCQERYWHCPKSYIKELTVQQLHGPEIFTLFLRAVVLKM